MKPTDKATFWQQHINQWQRSGGSQQHYCEKHKLSLANFGYWRRQLAATSPVANKLIPVHIGSPSSLIHIRLPGGVELDVPLMALEEVLPVLARSMLERP